MGISIEYSGRVDDRSKLKELLNDVRRVSKTFGWKCKDVSMQISGVELLATARGRTPGRSRPLVKEELRGVYVQPPDTETLQLIFNKKGRLCHYQELTADMISGPLLRDVSYFSEFPLWVKTTGAVDSHVLILALLERLKRRFMKNLSIRDDTEFYTRCDVKQLGEAFASVAVLARRLSDPGMTKSLLKAASAKAS